MLLDGTTNFLSHTRRTRLALTDTVLVAGNGQQAFDLLHTHSSSFASTVPVHRRPLKRFIAVGIPWKYTSG